MQVPRARRRSRRVRYDAGSGMQPPCGSLGPAEESPDTIGHGGG